MQKNNNNDKRENVFIHLIKMLDSHEKDPVNKQKLRVFFHFNILMEICTLSGIAYSFYHGWYFLTTVLAGYFFILLVPFWCYFQKIWSITLALRYILYASQIVISIQMVHIANSYNNNSTEAMLFGGYYVPLLLNASLSVIAVQKYDTVIISILSVILSFSCAYIMDLPMAFHFSFGLIVVFATLSILGTSMVNRTSQMNDENIEMKDNEQRLFALFKLHRNQLKAYIELAEHEINVDRSTTLLDMFDTQSRNNIVNNVQRYMMQKNYTINVISDRFPELTTSEVEVCRLVLMNKKLGDICCILDKSESNITTTRAHIRKKLGLSKEENLRTALDEKMKSYNA